MRAVAAADPHYDAAIPHRRPVLVSDLLEHDPEGFSLCVAGSNYSNWRAQAPNDPPDFAHVDLRIVPLDRPDHAAEQAAALERFWPAFFDAADACSASIDPAP